jgi:hypothetical protein
MPGRDGDMSVDPKGDFALAPLIGSLITDARREQRREASHDQLQPRLNLSATLGEWRTK